MNKPVAWISRLPEGDVYNCAWAEKQNDDDIPLYTAEQIIEKNKPEIEKANAYIKSLEDEIAILRKAQTK